LTPGNLIQDLLQRSEAQVNPSINKLEALVPTLHTMHADKAPTILKLAKMSEFTSHIAGSSEPVRTVVLLLRVKKQASSSSDEKDHLRLSNSEFWLKGLSERYRKDPPKIPEPQVQSEKAQLKQQKKRVVDVIINILQVITLNQGEGQLMSKIEKTKRSKKMAEM